MVGLTPLSSPYIGVMHPKSLKCWVFCSFRAVISHAEPRVTDLGRSNARNLRSEARDGSADGLNRPRHPKNADAGAETAPEDLENLRG